jgi:Transposase zinc-binding domain
VLYEVVRENLETLYGAIGDGALAVRIPKHARKELEAYLDCGLLCRGFARLKYQDCGERGLVAFSCKGHGFCPSCTGRRIRATAANLAERVLPPESGLRQWVLTFPFSWRRRLAQDGALLGRLSRELWEPSRKFSLKNGSGRRRRGGPYLPELSGQYPRWPGSPIDDFRAQDELHVLSPPIRRRDAQRSLEIRRIRDELACRERAIRLDTGH